MDDFPSIILIWRKITKLIFHSVHSELHFEQLFRDEVRIPSIVRFFLNSVLWNTLMVHQE